MTTDQDRYQTTAEVRQTYCPVCGRIVMRERIGKMDRQGGGSWRLWVCQKCRTVTAEEFDK